MWKVSTVSHWRRVARRPNDTGAAAVEFALVITPLIILVFGIIGFGIVLSQQLTLSNSAREAARFVVTQDRTCGDAMAQVQSGASTLGMDPSQVAVEVIGPDGSAVCGPAKGAFSGSEASTKPCAGSSVGDSVKVVARFDSSLLIPLVVTDNSFGLTSEGIFRCEFR